MTAKRDHSGGLIGLLAVSLGLCCGLPILLGAGVAISGAGLVTGSALLAAAGIALGAWGWRRWHPPPAANGSGQARPRARHPHPGHAHQPSPDPRPHQRRLAPAPSRPAEGPSMPTPTIAELRTVWTTRPVFSNGPVTRAAIALLADARPATAEALAAATGMTIKEVAAYIATAGSRGIEVVDGAIVGAALTLRPTGHRFRIRGNNLHTWCGFDALFLPIMLGERAEVISTCPATGTEIKLTVQADGTVSHADPERAVIGIVGQDITSCCPTTGPQSAVCTQMPFFASRDAAEHWLTGHPGVAVVDLDDASEIARAYVQSR